MATKKRATKKSTKATTQIEPIDIQRVQLKRLDVTIIGDTPLVTHSWSEKARLEMLAKQMQIPLPKTAKDPVDHFLRAMYRLDDGNYGIPAVAIKRTMVTACVDLVNVTKAGAMRAFRVLGERGHTHAAFCGLKTPMDLLKIVSPNPPTMREDAVRLAGPSRTADLRYRPEFSPWGAMISIDYNPDSITAESLISLLNFAGFSIGLCEFRQEKGGDLGAFHVADAKEHRQVLKWANAEPKEPELPDTEAWRAGLDELRRREKAA